MRATSFGSAIAPIPIEWNLTDTTMTFPTPTETTADCVLHAVLQAKLSTHRDINLVLEPFKLAALPPPRHKPNMQNLSNRHTKVLWVK